MKGSHPVQLIELILNGLLVAKNEVEVKLIQRGGHHVVVGCVLHVVDALLHHARNM